MNSLFVRWRKGGLRLGRVVTQEQEDFFKNIHQRHSGVDIVQMQI